MLGRKKALAERWKARSVCKSVLGLKKMKLRSSITMDVGMWLEMLDPASGSLWYIHKRDWRSSWFPPEGEVHEAVTKRQRLRALLQDVEEQLTSMPERLEDEITHATRVKGKAHRRARAAEMSVVEAGT